MNWLNNIFLLISVTHHCSRQVFFSRTNLFFSFASFLTYLNKKIDTRRFYFMTGSISEDLKEAISSKIGYTQDYPKPMCSHAYVSKMNMERMKQVYQELAQCSRSGQVVFIWILQIFILHLISFLYLLCYREFQNQVNGSVTSSDPSHLSFGLS